MYNVYHARSQGPKTLRLRVGVITKLRGCVGGRNLLFLGVGNRTWLAFQCGSVFDVVWWLQITPYYSVGFEIDMFICRGVEIDVVLACGPEITSFQNLNRTFLGFRVHIENWTSCLW